MVVGATVVAALVVVVGIAVVAAVVPVDAYVVVVGITVVVTVAAYVVVGAAVIGGEGGGVGFFLGPALISVIFRLRIRNTMLIYVIDFIFNIIT